MMFFSMSAWLGGTPIESFQTCTLLQALQQLTRRARLVRQLQAAASTITLAHAFRSYGRHSFHQALQMLTAMPPWNE